MSDTTVTVTEPPDGEQPTTPDTVAETAVAAIGETARSTAQAETASQRAQDASYTATSSEEQARLHAERAQQAADSIGQWATSISEAVARIPEKIGETLQALVTSAPASSEPAPTPEPESQKEVAKPQGHWMDRPLFGRKRS